MTARITLEDKVVVVTGASRGIGEAIARAVAAAGGAVVLASRKQEGLDAVAAAITAEGGTAVPVATHIGQPEAVEALFSRVMDEFGKIDGLVNNAATNPYFGPAHGLPPDAFDKTVEVNLKGPYYMMANAVPLIIESGGGSVVNVASIVAKMTWAGQAPYAMTKAGLISLTRSFAKEYGPSGVRVNAILPGLVETRFAEALVEDPKVQKWVAHLPVPRAGQPEDMVAGVLYLVSDQAAYTTGTTLVMDGGATLG